MNKLEDGTQWILPPRTASRYTVGLLWRYGLTHFSEHGYNFEKFDPDSKTVMNIRNPFTRLRSFWRLVWKGFYPDGLTFRDYVMNLQTRKHQPVFANQVDLTPSYIYPIPMINYLDLLEQDIRKSDIDSVSVDFVRIENLKDDLEYVGYPVQSYNPAREISESGDGISDADWYMENQDCAAIIWQIYNRDFQEFGYSDNLLEMKENTGWAAMKVEK